MTPITTTNEQQKSTSGTRVVDSGMISRGKYTRWTSARLATTLDEQSVKVDAKSAHGTSPV